MKVPVARRDWAMLPSIVNCPACGYYNPPGQQSCFHCSLVLPLAAAGDAICAAHPEVKATGACSRCGTFGCGACLTARGSDWLCPQCLGRVGVLPWDERDQLGLWRAWWRTSVQMISSPTLTLSSAEPDAPLGSSMVFATLSTLVGFGPTLVAYLVVLVPALLWTEKKLEFGAAGALLPLFFIGYVLMLFVFQLGSVLFISAVDHLGLMLVGARPKAFTVTVRAHALSMGPYLLGLLPLCSFYVFPLWSIVLRVLANMHLHKTTAGRAAVAVLAPLVLLCGGVLVLYAAVFALAAGLKR